MLSTKIPTWSNLRSASTLASTILTLVLAKVLAERKFDQVGILVDSVSREYWAKMANEMAEKELT